MIKVLVKKQLLEVFAWLYQDRKTGNRRTGSRMVVFALLYALVFAMVVYMFLGLGMSLCPPLVAADMGWLYVAIMCLLGMMFGVLGSVFGTYASLYKAGDNDILLSMPIPVRSILLGRLSGVFAMGLLYEALAMVPALGVYFYYAPPSAASIAFGVLLVLFISLLILALSCVLGWMVATVGSRLQNQKIVTVVISLAFFAVYYYLCGNANGMIELLLKNPAATGDTVKGVLYPLYLAGRGAEGDAPSMLAFAALTLVVVAVVYAVMSHSFVRMATSNRGQKKIAYVEKSVRAASPDQALLRKELRRFTGSATYMLNSGLGIVLLPVAGIALLVMRGNILPVLTKIAMLVGDVVWVFAPLVVCLATTMCCITAPSISLEGKSLWQTRVLPASGWQVLRAKRNAHLVLTLPPALVLVVCVATLMPLSPFVLLMPLTVALFVLLMANIGLVLNLKSHSFNWTTEVVPIKQGASVVISLFGGWTLVLALGGLGYLLVGVVPPLAAALALCVLLLVVDVALTQWLKTAGARCFEAL